MSVITKEYSLLFNEITEVSEALVKLYQRLLEAQRCAEEIYIKDEDMKDEPVLSEKLV